MPDMTKLNFWTKIAKSNHGKAKKAKATRSAYKRQIHFCTKILRKTKKEFCNDLNVKYISKNKLFWKTVKPYFMDETSKVERITLNANY